MAFGGGNTDTIRGQTYWAVSYDGLNWDVYNTSYAGGSWTPILAPLYGSDCDKYGLVGDMLTYDPDPALGPEGGFYIHFGYYHPGAVFGTGPTEMMAFRFSYSSTHPYGFGGSVVEMFVDGRWVPHSGKLVWDYDGQPPYGSDPILRVHHSMDGFVAPLAYPAAIGDMKFDPSRNQWVYVFSRYGKLYTQTSQSLAAARWSRPVELDASLYLASYPLRPHGFLYYPGIWWGTLSSRTGFYIFIPTDVDLCETTEASFAGLGMVSADLDSRAEPSNTFASGYYTLTPCRLLDTRLPSGTFGGPSISQRTKRFFPINGDCGVPASAKAIATNVTAVAPTGEGNVIVYPGNEWTPLVSTVNYRAGQVRANNAIVSLDTAIVGAAGPRGFSIYCDQIVGVADVIVDVVGYFQ